MTRRPRTVPTCHPDRKHAARGLCSGCVEHHRRAGTLDNFASLQAVRRESYMAIYAGGRAAGKRLKEIAAECQLSLGGLSQAVAAARRAGDPRADTPRAKLPPAPRIRPPRTRRPRVKTQELAA